MPRVPTYDEFQVRGQPMPAVQQRSVASPGMFSGAAETSAGLARATGEAADALRKMEDQEDLYRSQEADALYKERLFDFQQKAHENYKGVNADQALPDFDEWHKKTVDEIGQNLKNDRQRSVFALNSTKNYNLGRSSLGNFVLSEKAKNRTAAFEATTRLEIDGAALATTPVEVSVRKGNLLANIDAYAASEGIPKQGPVYESLVSRQLSAFHAARVKTLLDDSATGYKQAAEYWKANKDEVRDAQTREMLDKYMATAGEVYEGAAFVKREDIALLSEKDALTAADDAFKDHPKKLAHAKLAIRRKFTEERQVRDDAQRDAADQAYQIFADTKDLSRVPPSLLASMDREDRTALERLAATGGKAKTDPNTYYDLRTMAATRPEEFATVDLRRYFDRLDEADREKFINLQQDVKKGSKPPATWEQQKSQRHNEMGFKASDREKKGSFDRIADEAFEQTKKTLGREPTYEEGQKLLDRLMLQGDVNGWLPGGKRRYFQVLGTEESAKFVPDIPEADRTAVKERFQHLKGRLPTDAELVDAYRKWKGL